MDIRKLCNESLFDKMKNGIEFDFEMNGNKFRFSTYPFQFVRTVFCYAKYYITFRLFGRIHEKQFYSHNINDVIQWCNNFDPNDPAHITFEDRIKNNDIFI